MTIEHFLDLAREDVLTADDQHFLDTAGDVEEAVAIEAAHITGTKETLIIEHRRGFVGKVAIALHHVRTLDADLAVLVRRQDATIRRNDPLFDSRKRLAHRALA